MKTPILGGYAVARSVNAADNRLMNLYPEATPEGGKSSGFLTRCPGYKYIRNLGTGPIRGLWTFGGFLYAVSGVELYKIDSEFVPVLIGTVSGSGPVSMSDNGDQLFIACNPRSYTYSVISNTFAEITDPDFPGAVTVGFINGYFVFNEPDSQKVWITSYQDGSAVDPLEFAFTDANPDNLLSLVVNRNEIWMFGTTSTEVWYYSGDIDFPLARIQGAFNEIGCAAPYSVAKLDNTVFWLGSDPRGNAMVYKAVGYGAQRVSTHGIEKVLQGYQYVGDAIGYSYQQEGHTFYVLTFPSANATWVFDAATNEWHERGSWKQGRYNRHRSNCQANFSNKIVLGDFQLGKLYEFDLEYYQDDEGTQRWLRSWRALPPNANNLNRTAHHSLQVEMETGTKTIYRTTFSPGNPTPQTFTSTFTPLHTSPAIDLTNDNLTAQRNSQTFDWASTQSAKTWYNGDKVYCEFTFDEINPNSNTIIGVGQATAPYSGNGLAAVGLYPPLGVGYIAYGDGGYFPNYIKNENTIVQDLSAYGDAQAGDVIMVAVECGDVSAWHNGFFNNPGNPSSMGGLVWFGRNGVWLNGNPSNMTGGAALFPGTGQPSDPAYANVAAIVALWGYNKITANFGGQPFAYTVPTGFSPWNQSTSSSYNALNTNYYANGFGDTLAVSSSTVSNGAQIPLMYEFAMSNLSASKGKVYFEASYDRSDESVGQEQFIGLGEGGMSLVYEPAGFTPAPYPIYRYHEGCVLEFGVSSLIPNPSPITSLTYGRKIDPTTKLPDSSISTISPIPAPYKYERVMFAIDFDAGKAWLGSKGIWGGDPVTGIGWAWEFTPNTELYVYAGLKGLDLASSVSTFFSPTSFQYPIPEGYAPFNVDEFVATTTERIPKVLLRWSDDGGHTWSNYYDRELGSIGEYWTRVIWRRLGMTTKLRDRVYELSGSDPVKITITGAELLLSGTNS